MTRNGWRLELTHGQEWVKRPGQSKLVSFWVKDNPNCAKHLRLCITVAEDQDIEQALAKGEQQFQKGCGCALPGIAYCQDGGEAWKNLDRHP